MVRRGDDDAVIFMLVAAFAVVFIFFLHDMANTPVRPLMHAHHAKVALVTGETVPDEGGLDRGWGPTNHALYVSMSVHDPLGKMHDPVSLLRVPDPDLLIQWSRQRATTCIWVPDWKNGWPSERPKFCRPDTSWITGY